MPIRSTSAPLPCVLKKRQERAATASNKSRRISSPTRMISRLPIHPPSRQHTLSAASRARNPANTVKTCARPPGAVPAVVIASTSSLSPYCAPTAINAPPVTAASSPEASPEWRRL